MWLSNEKGYFFALVFPSAPIHFSIDTQPPLTHYLHSVLSCLVPLLCIVFAGYVSLVNAARARKGKPPIGFVNKMLYDIGAKNSSLYNDVTEGHNKCCAQTNSNKGPICCNTGFESAPGWDPVVSTSSHAMPCDIALCLLLSYLGLDSILFYCIMQ